MKESMLDKCARGNADRTSLLSSGKGGYENNEKTEF